MAIVVAVFLVSIISGAIGWLMRGAWDHIGYIVLYDAAEAVWASRGVVTTYDAQNDRHVHQTVDPEALQRLDDALT